MLTVIGAALLLAGCTETDREVMCEEGWNEAERKMSVSTAVESPPSGRVAVSGALVVRGLETRLCTTLVAGGRCGEPSLRVVGIGNAFRAVDGMTVKQLDPPTGWTEAVSIDGVVDEGALRIPLTCRSVRAIEHFSDETGQRLHRDLFFSGEDADFLSFEAAPDPDIVAARRREWGRFSVLVMVDSPQPALEWRLEQLEPYFVEPPSGEPDRRGIVWVRLERQAGPV